MLPKLLPLKGFGIEQAEELSEDKTERYQLQLGFPSRGFKVSLVHTRLGHRLARAPRQSWSACLPVCLSVCLSVRPRLAWVSALGRWAPGCVCARAGRLSGEKERRRLGRAGGRPGVGRGLCGEQPNGASWFCLRSRFHFCLITRPWPTSQDRFFSTTFYLEEPFCIFIKNCPGSNFGMSRCCR